MVNLDRRAADGRAQLVDFTRERCSASASHRRPAALALDGIGHVQPADCLTHGAGSDSMPAMNCRPRCGACCIAPSISSPIPGMPGGKPAGVRCVQLDTDDRCRLFGNPARPAVCASLQPHVEMCGASRRHAMAWLTRLDRQTSAH
jgi:uncharacterized protein